jgi:cellulose synthase/poly-beta-1,6-N-acetylglucosamine synthase-like glycosyltransferase
VTEFLHYFLGILDPVTILGFLRAAPDLMVSAFIRWWLFVLLFAILVLPSVACWLVYFVNPALIRPPLSPHPKQAEPLVSVVIAGRNEGASIGQCIRAALHCGYSNLEVIFVDDCSEDDSVTAAERAAHGVTGSSCDSARVRIFRSPRRNGKASELNIGIRLARGEFIAIIDADSAIQYGAVQYWLLPFTEPRVGGVCANIRVNNSTQSLLTRLQEIEYALRFTTGRSAAALFNILPVIPGMGGIFRAEALRRLGGFDTGLGDDTDLTMNLRKQRWKLAFSLDALVWTNVPVTREHLWRQRIRWQRNVIKIRLSKHRDMIALWRYGPANALLVVQTLLVRMIWPWALTLGVLLTIGESGFVSIPGVLGTTYWLSLLYALIKALIARDYSRTPQPVHFWLLFLFPFYMFSLRIVNMYATFCELVRIGAKHPYVPDHIWREIPWW